jgi:putative colanic acid biosynthesis UDP-glucose lipid carrier transferase
MSAVGPRPHLIEHNEQFAQLMSSCQVRTLVKPGVTGLAQVRGCRGEARTSKDIENRVACDLEGWNLTLQCGIIARVRATGGAAGLGVLSNRMGPVGPSS